MNTKNNTEQPDNDFNKQINKDKINKKNSEIKEWTISIVVSALLVILLRNFILGIAIVEGDSMLNSIQDGDRIAYAKFIEPEAGDVVVVETSEGTKIIKRVLGVEGDKIRIDSGKLYVNNKEVQEDYIKEKMYDESMEEITVPSGEIFVLGDNRNISLDSRYYGTFNLEEEYQGKVVLEFFNDFQTY